MKRSKNAAVLFVVCLSSALMTTTAVGEMIQIHFTGLNFKYSGNQIYDSASVLGRLGTAYADSLANVDIFREEVLEVSMGNGAAFADLLISGVGNIPKNGGTVPAAPLAGFGLDLLYANGQKMLEMNIQNFSVSYFGNGILIAAGGTAQQIVTQNLPNGLVINDQDIVSILVSSSNMTNIKLSGDKQYVVSFDAFGTGDVTGTVVPEPASMFGLLSLGGVGLAWALLRRKRRV